MTTSITVTSIKDAGNDVLAVEGVRDARVITATGWVSATTNHYAADTYDDDGHRKQGSTPREMARSEVLEYARGLLEAQNVDPAAPAAARDLGFADPTATDALAAVAKREEEEAERAAAAAEAAQAVEAP